jgi:hypothetical protein
MTWKKERRTKGNKFVDFLVEYDEKGNKTGREQDVTISTWDYKDGFATNNKFLQTSTHRQSKAQEVYKLLLEGNKLPTAVELGVSEKDYKLIVKDAERLAYINGVDYKKLASNGENIDVLNPYTAYLEEQRMKQQNAELGLLNAQADMNVQNAEISAQQSMMQQAQLKDQIVEQLKTDRLSKMRSGLTPMQIAQEDLQFMVGNMQANNQNMQMVNQQRLMAQQQKALNPYQAYINSQAAITGGQGYVNLASGLAATDAGDMNQQALRFKQNQNKGYLTTKDLAYVKS